MKTINFVDMNNAPLKRGDLISFEGHNPELLYACDMGDGVTGLGVNASRHYVGSELYPLTDFPCEDVGDNLIRMTTGRKVGSKREG
jgi:hypothetical protein